jgi:hypothetical protein
VLVLPCPAGPWGLVHMAILSPASCLQNAIGGSLNDLVQMALAAKPFGLSFECVSHECMHAAAPNATHVPADVLISFADNTGPLRAP